jgi:hypothetical protein
MRCRRLVLGLLAGLAIAAAATGMAGVTGHAAGPSVPVALGILKGPGGPPDPGPIG